MEDSKIKDINDHPDRFEDEEHKINITNLRKGLKLLGYEVEEKGAFDDEVWIAFVKHLVSRPFPKKFEKTHTVENGEDLGSIAVDYGINSWKYLYEINKEVIGDNPDILETGIELAIPRWDDTQGDEEIEKKGARAFDYVNGLRYSYVWVPFSISFMNLSDKPFMFEKEQKLLVTLNKTGMEISKKTVSDWKDVHCLVPQTDDISISFGGLFFES
jgi:hypothetical protein